MSPGSALVTGASGFIGRALATRLVAEGWIVSCLGRNDPSIPGARFLKVRSLADAELHRAVGGRRIDVVFHLAAYGVSPGDRETTTAFEANVQGTASVVEMAAKVGADTLVYTGSCSEYADCEPGHLISEDHPLTTTNLYGASKAAAGIWAAATARQLGVSFRWIRLFGVFGPGEAPHRLLPSLVSSLQRGQPVDLSPGYQMRDMLHIDEAVSGLIEAARMSDTAGGRAYNLCSGRPTSVKAFAGLVADALGRSQDLLRFGAIDYRPGETMWMVGSPAAFAKASGFQSRVELAEALARSLTGRNTLRPASE